MSLGSYIVRVAGGADKEIVAASKALVAYVDDVVVNDIDPAVENFFTTVVPAEVAALKPYAQEALTELAVDLPTLLAGGPSAFFAAVAPSLALTAAKAEAASVAAAKPLVLAAVGSVIADAQSAIGGTTPAAAPAPTPSPAPATAPTPSPSHTDNGDGSSAPAGAAAVDNGDGSSGTAANADGAGTTS